VRKDTNLLIVKTVIEILQNGGHHEKRLREVVINYLREKR
jgi:hypothetical protein